MPEYIPSPYNFVPLSDKVFFPDEWSKQASMDIPFKDGISGTLTLRVTAKTPIYIRNGGVESNADYQEFFSVYPGGPYAIPGSSIKGMLRAVVEIASFGKIAGSEKESRVDNRRYSIRDLTPGAREVYGEYLTQEVNSRGEEIVGGRASNKYWKPRAQAGWLSQESDDSWNLTKCRYSRVGHEELKKEYRWNSSHEKIDKLSGPDKYALWPGGVQNTAIHFTPGPEMPHGKFFYSMAGDVGSGNTEGRIVFTGQPSPKKTKEFIFHGEQYPSVNVDDLRDDFVDVHTHEKKVLGNWEFWRNILNDGGRVPVFFLEDDDGKPTSMGLAMMYRFPYKHKIHDAIKSVSGKHCDSRQMDLGEVMFGRVDDTSALRGRINAETFICNGAVQPLDTVETVLNSPKPSFYPNYLEQNNPNEFMTLMGDKDDNHPKIRGWKRYLVAPDALSVPGNRQCSGEVGEGVGTKFKPLPAGTVFEGCLHLHNMRPQEIGALIWAITWGGRPYLRHSIGMAKPYGYGAVTVEIVYRNLSWCDPASQQAIPSDTEMMNEFMTTMKDSLQNWEESQQIKSLLAMADPTSEWGARLVRYPRLSPEDEFRHYKSNNIRLRSDLSRIWRDSENRRKPPEPILSDIERAFNIWMGPIGQGTPPSLDDLFHPDKLVRRLGIELEQSEAQELQTRMLRRLEEIPGYIKEQKKKHKKGKGSFTKLCELDAQLGVGLFQNTDTLNQ